MFVQDPELGLLRIDRPENGGSGRLEGVEAQFTSFADFEFLPEWARGFGFQGNFTYIKGNQGAPAQFGGVITERFGFGGVSKYTYNLVGIYAGLAEVTKAEVLKQFGGGQFSTFKTALSDLAVEKLSPIAAEMRRLTHDPGHIDAILADGSDRASAIAAETMNAIKDIMGFIRH